MLSVLIASCWPMKLPGVRSCGWHAIRPWVVPHVPPPRQLWPHTPQFLRSDVRSTHAPEQSLRLALQVMPQLPLVQVALPLVGTGQAAQELPQLLTLVFDAQLLL